MTAPPLPDGQREDRQPGEHICPQANDPGLGQQVQVVVVGVAERILPLHQRVGRVGYLVVVKPDSKPGTFAGHLKRRLPVGDALRHRVIAVRQLGSAHVCYGGQLIEEADHPAADGFGYPPVRPTESCKQDQDGNQRNTLDRRTRQKEHHHRSGTDKAHPGSPAPGRQQAGQY